MRPAAANFNMHFGYYRWGMNPIRREAMLEQMNVEMLSRLRVDAASPTRLLDMGCGLSATLRSLAQRLPLAELTGITLVPCPAKPSALFLRETYRLLRPGCCANAGSSKSSLN